MSDHLLKENTLLSKSQLELERHSPEYLEALTRNNTRAAMVTSSIVTGIGIAGLVGLFTGRATENIYTRIEPRILYELLILLNAPATFYCYCTLRKNDWSHAMRKLNAVYVHFLVCQLLAGVTIYTTQSGSSVFVEAMLILIPITLLPVYLLKRLWLGYFISGVTLSMIMGHLHIDLAWQDEYDLFIFYALCIYIALQRRAWFYQEFQADYKLKTINEILARENRTDELTGLGNRTALREDFPEYVEKDLCIAMADLDYFKEYNDKHGHMAGDEILKDLARSLKDILPQNAYAYRFGGDEFLIIAHDMKVSSFLEAMHAFRDSFSEKHPTGMESSLTIGYSYGIMHSEREIRACMNVADDCLYEAKKAEKGTILGRQFTPADMDQHGTDRTSMLDPLTSTQLRSTFIHELVNMEFPKEWAVLHFDIERFQQINKQYGFETGDEILKKIAQLLKEEFPDTPVARNDDQFILYTEADDYEARILRIQKNLAMALDRLHVVIRVGIYDSRDWDDVNMEVRYYMDMAKYACDSLRGQTAVLIRHYNKELDKQREQVAFVQNNFTSALDNRQIIPYYQPIVNAKTGECAGYEALARWIIPDQGLLSPGIFVPVLENAYESYLLDFSILEQVCVNLSEMSEEHRNSIFVSVNFSRSDFAVTDVPKEIDEIVTKHQISRSTIRVEITESTYADNEGIRKDVQRIRDMGYEVWLDDFGSGVSSITVMKDYTLDAAKLDMGFMRAAENQEKANTIVKAMIQLCHSVNMKTISEGVETKEQLDFVRSCGGELIQGYYYSRPLSLENLKKSSFWKE